MGKSNASPPWRSSGTGLWPLPGASPTPFAGQLSSSFLTTGMGCERFFVVELNRNWRFCRIFTGPESDHWQCLSLTDSLTNCRLENLIDVTLACEDAYSKLVEVVTGADVDSEDHVGNSLLQILELTFGHKAKLLFRL